MKDKTAYFKTTYRRGGGRDPLLVTRYIKVLGNGLMLTVDVTRCKVSVNKTFGGLPIVITVSSRSTFYKNYSSTLKKMENGNILNLRLK